jgi:hypothetical protein
VLKTGLEALSQSKLVVEPLRLVLLLDNLKSTTGSWHFFAGKRL